MTNDQDAVRTVIDSLWRAIGAKKADDAIAQYAPNPVVYSLAPPLRQEAHGPAGLNAWFETWRGPIGVEMRDVQVTVGSDVAFATSLNRMTGTKTDGEQVDLWFRATIGLRRIDGRWLVVHEHESVPFLMDGSNLAALHLKP
jgi:ketosteroid isomerase-like protein